MRLRTFGLVLATAIALFAAGAAGAAPTLQLAPAGGALTGSPGATVGWGFTITNSTDYLVVTSASFTPSTTLGTFTDFIAQYQFVVVGPSPESTSVSQGFNNGSHTGVGSFAISAGAHPGDAASGTITVTYDLYSVSPNDPNFDPGIDLVLTDNTLTAAASVSVPAPPAIAKAFDPAQVPLGQSSSLTFTLTNPNAFLALTGVAFSDPLPTGLVVSTPNGLSGTCGGSVTADAGSSTISLSGGTIAAGGQCAFSVDVTATTPGTKSNTTGSVASTEGGTGGTASAALDVIPPIPALDGTALAALAALVAIVAAAALRCSAS
ncbi:MAG: hypothetical protein ACHQQS_10960 [Thermoanaerobaculales bacterium]